jgi:CRISPR/Cas system-associated protein Cas5 (RAMP superfamily)
VRDKLYWEKYNKKEKNKIIAKYVNSIRNKKIQKDLTNPNINPFEKLKISKKAYAYSIQYS